MQLHSRLEHHQPQCLQQARRLVQEIPLFRGFSTGTIQHEHKRRLGQVLAQKPILAAAAAESDGSSIAGPAAAAPGPVAKLRRRVVSIFSISIKLLHNGHYHAY